MKTRKVIFEFNWKFIYTSEINLNRWKSTQRHTHTRTHTNLIEYELLRFSNRHDDKIALTRFGQTENRPFGRNFLNELTRISFSIYFNNFFNKLTTKKHIIETLENVHYFLYFSINFFSLFTLNFSRT